MLPLIAKDAVDEIVRAEVDDKRDAYRKEEGTLLLAKQRDNIFFFWEVIIVFKLTQRTVLSWRNVRVQSSLLRPWSHLIGRDLLSCRYSSVHHPVVYCIRRHS